MADKNEHGIPGLDEAVQDVADYFDSGGDREPQEREEITIKFGKGLVGEPFMSKAGKELRLLQPFRLLKPLCSIRGIYEWEVV